MKVGIGIPCDRDMPIQTVQSLLGLNPVKDVTVLWIWGRGGTVDKQRAQIAASAIEQGCNYLFFIDSDMVIPPNAIKVLIEASCKHHAAIVTGVYFGRTEEGRCVVFADAATGDGYYPVEIKLPEYPVEPFEVDYAGLGCCLIRVDLLEWMVDQMGIDFIFHPDVKSSEDLSFFRRAQRVGAKIVCDPTLRLGHVGVKVYTWENHVQSMDTTRGCHHNLDLLAKQVCQGIKINSFLDIGANDGNETEIMRWRLGLDRQSVVCAEPLKELALRITKTYGFKAFNCAVGTAKGKGELKLPSTGDSVMSGLNVPLRWEVKSTREVDILPASEIIRDMVGDVYCRIDTEGSAYDVIQSFGDQIRRVKVFQIETELAPMFENQRLNAEVEGLLIDSGFDIALRKPIWPGQVEVFAVRED